MFTNRLYFVVALGAGLASGCAERSSPAGPTLVFQAVAPTAAPAPFVTGLVNPCNGEFVDIEGWIQVRYDTRTDEHGGSHTVGRILEHGAGAGAVTGAAYVFAADTIFDANAETIQFGVTENVIVRLLGQGQAPNFLGLQVLHFTVNPNGDLVGVVEDFRSECR
ncbi:MAG TPA: hypothetical protein VF919_13080 [Gemmatimonadales bacterium]